MRLSPWRVLLRVGLLAVGGAYMLARAWEAWATARRAPPGDALLASRLAVIWALAGALALVTAGGVALSFRRRRRRHTLRLGEPTLPAPGRPGGDQ